MKTVEAPPFTRTVDAEPTSQLSPDTDPTVNPPTTEIAPTQPEVLEKPADIVEADTEILGKRVVRNKTGEAAHNTFYKIDKLFQHSRNTLTAPRQWNAKMWANIAQASHDRRQARVDSKTRLNHTWKTGRMNVLDAEYKSMKDEAEKTTNQRLKARRLEKLQTKYDKEKSKVDTKFAEKEQKIKGKQDKVDNHKRDTLDRRVGNHKAHLDRRQGRLDHALDRKKDRWEQVEATRRAYVDKKAEAIGHRELRRRTKEQLRFDKAGMIERLGIVRATLKGAAGEGLKDLGKKVVEAAQAKKELAKSRHSINQTLQAIDTLSSQQAEVGLKADNIEKIRSDLKAELSTVEASIKATTDEISKLDEEIEASWNHDAPLRPDYLQRHADLPQQLDKLRQRKAQLTAHLTYNEQDFNHAARAKATLDQQKAAREADLAATQASRPAHDARVQAARDAADTLINGQ